MAPGLLITYEGRDACGKQTQSELMGDALRQLGLDATVYHFPRYETKLGDVIRKDLRQEAAYCDYVAEHGLANGEWVEGKHEPSPERFLIFQVMMLADKMEVMGDITRQLAEGGVVICDRWKPSGECFAPSDGVDREWVQRSQSTIPDGDVNFLLDVPTEIAAERRPALRDRYEKDRPRQERLRKDFTDFWVNHPPTGRWVIVDGTSTREVILTQTRKIVLEVAGARAALTGLPKFVDDVGNEIALRRQGDLIHVRWEGGETRRDSILVREVADWCRRTKSHLASVSRPKPGDTDEGLYPMHLVKKDFHFAARVEKVRALVRQLQLMTLSES